MKDPFRFWRIAYKIGNLWSQYPEWRLCQLLSNLHGPGTHDLFHVEDAALEDLLDKELEKLKQEKPA